MGGRWPTAGPRPCLGSRGALRWLPPQKHAGPRRVGPSKLRTEISAGLGLDSDLPRQHAASLRSARVAEVRRPLSGMSPQRDACLPSSLLHLLSRTATGRPEADCSLRSRVKRLRCRRWGWTRRSSAVSPAFLWLLPHPAAVQSTHTTDSSGPTLSNSPIRVQSFGF